MLSNTFAQVFVPPIIQYVPPVIPEETFNFSTSDVENTGNEFLEFDGMPLTVMVTDGTNPSISCDLDYGTLKNSFDLGYDQGTPSQEVYDILDPDVAGAIDGSGDAFFIVVYSGYYVPNDQLYLFY